MTNTRSPMAVTKVRPRWVLALTSIAYFMVVLDSLVVVTALPRMQRDLHAGLAALQWTVNSYGIAFAAGIITAAALGDRFGRRRVFTFGLALFTLSSAGCALSPDAAALIVARTAQGLGAAIILPLSLTILTAAFPPQRRGLIVGIYGGLAGLAVAAGPLVGGAVTESLDWHWIFWLNVPIGLVAATLGTWLLPESHGAPQPLDLVGVAFVTGGAVALVWAMVRAHSVGWSSPQTIATLLAGCALLLSFVRWQRQAHAPLVPLGLFGNRAFAAGTVTGFLMSGATFAAAFLVTQEFQFARGYSPISTGLRLLPFFATPMVISPLAGAISDRIGRRPIMVTGLVLQALGFTWVAARGSLATSWVELVIALLVAGVGISMALPTVPTAVLNAVPTIHLGKASGINYMAQRLGTVFAIAIGTAVFSAHGHLGNPAAVTAGFRPALWSTVAFAALAAAAALAIPEPGHRTTNPQVSAHTNAADALVAAQPKGSAMPDILHRISIDAPPQRVHDLIASTDGIARWWTGRPLTGEHANGSSFSVYFGDADQPAAVMQVLTDSPDQVVWRVTDGPDTWIDTRITFTLRPSGHDGTTLLFTHADWQQASEFMSGCSTNWGAYLTSLKTGAESNAFAAYPDGEISRWD